MPAPVLLEQGLLASVPSAFCLSATISHTFSPFLVLLQLLKCVSRCLRSRRRSSISFCLCLKQNAFSCSLQLMIQLVCLSCLSLMKSAAVAHFRQGIHTVGISPHLQEPGSIIQVCSRENTTFFRQARWWVLAWRALRVSTALLLLLASFGRFLLLLFLCLACPLASISATSSSISLSRLFSANLNILPIFW